MRARRTLDADRISSLVSRPGIDPRLWLSMAVVTKIGFSPTEGTFVDVELIPTGEPETAYLGSPYAGTAWGDHCPLEVDDTVLVAIPNGDPAAGCVVVARFHDASDPPNSEIGTTEKTSRVIRAKPGERVVIRTSLAGAVSLVSEGAGDVEVTSLGGMVQLGALAPGAPAQDFVAHATPLVADLATLNAALATLTAALAAYSAAIQPLADPSGTATTTLGTAIAAFTAATAAIPNPAIPATKVRAT